MRARSTIPCVLSAPLAVLTALVPIHAVNVVDWRIDSLAEIGGYPVTVLGSPTVLETAVGRAVEFNGRTDGLFLEVNPLAGFERFTVEALFELASDGPPEQRFLHFEAASGDHRALLETRMLDLPVSDARSPEAGPPGPARRWALDTFLKDGDAALTLLDRTRAHDAGGWHAAALVYDGKEMSHYVDGVRELAGPVAFRPMGQGRTSIGVRQNEVYWFKGRIARVRVTPRALEPAEFMQRTGIAVR
jgi:hypothetical protein